MRSVAVGSSSGCLAWLMIFSALVTCFCSAAGLVGGLSGTIGAERVARFMEPWLCPDGSRAEVITFETTITSDGVERPATGYEMQCVDGAGAVTRAPSPDFAFYWTGLLLLGSVLLAALVSALLAAPVGALVARWAARRRAG